jgi:hypothetical protein
MDEQVARDVVLVRAIESADRERKILSDDDRMYASRSANELAQWDAADRKSALTTELFLQKRAEQVLKKIAERTPAFATVVARRNWPRKLGIGLPLLALLAGALVDRIADPHRVDLLSAPLLLIILWNLLVYAGLLLWPAIRFAVRQAVPSSRARTNAGLLERLANPRIAAPRKLPQALAAALSKFSAEWVALSAALTTARAKRIVHFSAAGFALGAVISLYLRGILAQYQAGWESTFLDAQQVHAVLSVLFMPAIALLHLPGFSIADVKALQFSPAGSPGSGALWVHLYAATLFLLVILPRTGLAFVARWKEKKLAAHFPLDLGQPYFRKLTEKIGPAAPAVLRVFPYSFSIDEVRDKNLAVVAKMLLGEQARVMLRPSTSYGEEPSEAQKTQKAGPLDEADIAHTVALFNLSATPEKENHGAFLDHLDHLNQLGAGAARGISVLIDESAYLERVGTQPGGPARVRERIALWRQFCELHEVPATVINLLDPAARSADIERGLAASTRQS